MTKETGKKTDPIESRLLSPTELQPKMDPLPQDLFSKADEPSPEKEGVVAPKSSRVIGNYKLLQQIGTGGMGQVWMAEQLRPVRRRVALKLIRSGLDDTQVHRRFEAERQALAMMDHQYIAKVFDAGTTEQGTPYFVMELVQGISITKFCDSNRLSLGERLELFAQVCSAIQHAHQKGIIHRDLKPSNILVTLYDGQPVPKIIDFGLAKALDHQNRLTDKTLFTEFGQVVGTLQYMSPEQTEMNALDVDTRTDIYSLGVLLYEILTGSTPIDGDSIAKLAIVKVLQNIREVDPPRPSVRFSSSSSTINAISNQRRIEPKNLHRKLRGDLDWIVMKALEKDRRRRYETAIGLAEDVKRFLNDQPISARPPSTVYRLQKFARKNTNAVYSLIGMTLMLLTGVYCGRAILGRVSHSSGTTNGQSSAAPDASTLAPLPAAPSFQSQRYRQPELGTAIEAASNFTFRRILLNASHVDVHSLLIDSNGLRSTFNAFDWPEFEVNGEKWLPQQESQLQNAEEMQKLDFLATDLRIVSANSWLLVHYDISASGIKIDFTHPPPGAGDCSIIIDIPYQVSGGSSEVYWVDNWDTRLFEYSPNPSGEVVPDLQLLNELKPFANYKHLTNHFVYDNQLMHADSKISSLLPKSGFLLSANRQFTVSDGFYRIETISDDGARILLDDQVVIDEWRGRLATQDFFDMPLKGGTHTIRVEYFQIDQSSCFDVNIRPVIERTLESRVQDLNLSQAIQLESLDSLNGVISPMN